MRFIVDLWLDGINDDPESSEQERACIDFIKEQLDISASSVKVARYNPEAPHA